MAERMMRQGGTTEDRIRFGLKLAAADADTNIVDILKRGLADYHAHYMKNPDAVDSLLNSGESNPDKGLSKTDLAAYTMVASTILNLDQTITKE